jgi:hypothetical protein
VYQKRKSSNQTNDLPSKKIQIFRIFAKKVDQTLHSSSRREMQSISLIRFLQVIIVLVQLSALFLVSDLCTTFEPAKVSIFHSLVERFSFQLSKSCVHTLADKNVTEAHELSTAEMNTTTPAPELTFGVQRYCLPVNLLRSK